MQSPFLQVCFRLLCHFVAGVVVTLAIARTDAAERARPNVLVILTDDQGYGDVSMNGGTDIRTPNIDRLAADGMRFTTMRSNATVCSPTRAALMTGVYADRAGVPGVIRTDPRNSWGHLDPSRVLLPELLRRAGYHTALVGKWHLGLAAPNLPNARGFTFFHGFLGDMMDSYTTHLRHGINYLRLNDAPVTAEGHATEVFTSWAIEYLRSRAHATEPFFLYLAYNAPHEPIEPTPDSLARVRARAPDLPPKRAADVALVEHLDEQIGRVLATLRELGLDQNTLVFFTSDNGGSLPSAASNAPWRGGKQSHYEGGLRVPFAVRWPGVIAPGSQSDYAGLTFDIFPTVLAAAGVPPPGDCDARNLMPVFRGTPPTETRELYFVRREGGPAYAGRDYVALIRGRWKLLQNDPFSLLELYDLSDDPQELVNRAAQQPAVMRELKAALQRQVQRAGAIPWQAPASVGPALDN